MLLMSIKWSPRINNSVPPSKTIWSFLRVLSISQAQATQATRIALCHPTQTRMRPRKLRALTRMSNQSPMSQKLFPLSGRKKTLKRRSTRTPSGKSCSETLESGLESGYRAKSQNYPLKIRTLQYRSLINFKKSRSEILRAQIKKQGLKTYKPWLNFITKSNNNHSRDNSTSTWRLMGQAWTSSMTSLAARLTTRTSRSSSHALALNTSSVSI